MKRLFGFVDLYDDPLFPPPLPPLPLLLLELPLELLEDLLEPPVKKFVINELPFEEPPRGSSLSILGNEISVKGGPSIGMAATASKTAGAQARSHNV